MRKGSNLIPSLALSFLTFFALMTLPFTGTQTNGSSTTQTTTVYVSPSKVYETVGNSFSVSIEISDVTDLFGWEFKFWWDTTLLSLMNVTEGSFLTAGGQTFFTYKLNSTASYVLVDCTLLGGNITGVTGNGTLAYITLKVNSVGECPLTLNDTKLVNSSEQAIPCQVISGYGYFTAAHDVAVTAVNVSPLTVLKGDLVYINVTVQNQGNYTENFNVTIYANSESIGMQSVLLDTGSSATIHFTWNTSSFAKGDYTIFASATIVQGESDTADNNMSAETPLTILYPGHDVAVTSVIASKTIVGQGYFVNITVRAKNYGIFNESFNVTVYVNSTAIQTQPVILSSGNDISLNFAWNTTSFDRGNYTVWAYASSVQNETDTTNNVNTNGLVLVTIPGDVNGDFEVTILDVTKICGIYASKQGQDQFIPECDIDNDGAITILDVVIACSHYAEKV